MKLFEFTQRFPDEASCESYLKAQREKSGIVCKKCGCQKNYWD
ncbi:MAG: IS1595 family transposase, partial [archaeon]|nr:IS1595 family transposase [archaeon]